MLQVNNNRKLLENTLDQIMTILGGSERKHSILSQIMKF